MTRGAAFLLLLILAMGASGCKRQKLAKQSQSLAGSEETSFTVTSVPDSLNTPVSFTYLTIRSKISIKSKNQNIDNASVTFRVKKDSAIWMSASVMGLEVMRGIISTEGVRMMDRMNKIYTETSYRVLAEKLGFPLDYPLLEGFFLADIPVYPGQNFEIICDSTRTLVKQSDAYLSIYNLVDPAQKKTTRMEAIDLITGNHARSSYSDFQLYAEGTIPFNVSVDLSVRPRLTPEKVEQISVSLLHSGVSIADSTLSFPFQIPNNYKKAF